MSSKPTSNSIFSFIRGFRARLAIFVFIIASLALIGVGLLIHRNFIGFLKQDFDVELYNLVVDITDDIYFSPVSKPMIKISQDSFSRKILPFSEERSLYQIIDPTGAVIFKSKTLSNKEIPVEHADINTLLQEGVSFRTVTYKNLPFSGISESTFRLISVPIRHLGEIAFIFQLAAPLSSIQKEEKALNQFIGTSLIIALVLLVLGSIYISGIALKPLRQLIARAHQINSSALSTRLPVPDTGDELTELSVALNRALERLQKSFESQERFVADASHQLRTPLAVLLGEVDLLGSQKRSPQEIEDFVQTARQQVGYLSRLVDGLLILARISNQEGAALEKTPVRLDELLVSMLEKFDQRVRNKNLRLQFTAKLRNQSEDDPISEKDFTVEGDADLLISLFETLVDNAVKYSPNDAKIDVSLEATPSSLELTLQDEGPGIPSHLHEKVFDRFFRGETGSKGFGLGLTVAKKIAEAHGATLEILPSEKGTRIALKIPKLS